MENAITFTFQDVPKFAKDSCMIESEEWNFSQISDDGWELKWATLYEYARSITSTRRQIIKWHNSKPRPRHFEHFPELLSPKIRKRDLLRETYQKFGHKSQLSPTGLGCLDDIGRSFPRGAHGDVKPSCYIALRFPEFPEPWIKLRNRLDEAELRLRCQWVKSVYPFRALTEGELFFGLYDPSLAIGTFVINREAVADKIIDGFRAWLKANGVHAGARKKRHWHLLKQLATYRINEAIGSNLEAVGDLIDQVPSHPVVPNYSAQAGWLDVVRSVKKKLKSELELQEICREFHLE